MSIGASIAMRVPTVKTLFSGGGGRLGKDSEVADAKEKNRRKEKESKRLKRCIVVSEKERVVYAIPSMVTTSNVGKFIDGF